VVGLTGGIASGKSSVSQLLVSHGIPIVDADILARRVVEPGTSPHAQIVATFGSEVLLRDGSRAIDRKRLGEVVFNDEHKRKLLNAIVHPAVRREMIWDVARYWLTGHKVCVVDVPLLIEVGLWKYVSKVVLVYCSKDIQLQRLMRRDRIPQAAATARINSQLPLTSKLEYSDHVIDNSGSLVDLETQVASLVKRLKRDAGCMWVINWLIPLIGLVAGLLRLLWRSIRRRRRHGPPATLGEGEESPLAQSGCKDPILNKLKRSSTIYLCFTISHRCRF
ncbi:dephospho-CoA kinase-domain-containing protein, partial [Cantharellus anzutake]|uniref:dephospho-CoA kinase-domain-containing protein n=1 Tax=Cantharellus anzutake TaxID=1750568 RepID=UPI0019083224